MSFKRLGMIGGFALGIALSTLALEARPLDQAACDAAANEQAGIKDVAPLLERGPEWAKANASQASLSRVERWIELQEMLSFRCGRGLVTAEALKAAAAAELIENPPPPPPAPPAANGEKPAVEKPAAEKSTVPATPRPAKTANTPPAAAATLDANGEPVKPKPKAKPKPKPAADAAAVDKQSTASPLPSAGKDPAAPAPAKRKKPAPTASPDAYTPPPPQSAPSQND